MKLTAGTRLQIDFAYTCRLCTVWRDADSGDRVLVLPDGAQKPVLINPHRIRRILPAYRKETPCKTKCSTSNKPF